ncbi:PLC-like phosphodiesterase [Aspergillus karnatakaensis]|uniref:PLC-like phosphodiesterase n=1 Tax=Aspergillus karnatakaensis TaxID=1810916 RepID=UPI003CCD080D
MHIVHIMQNVRSGDKSRLHLKAGHADQLLNLFFNTTTVAQVEHSHTYRVLITMKFPQAIAHRGYKAAHPENTMAAFRGAVQVGAHAIETDVHLSKDGVVVLCHDVTLKRCFGDPRKVADCTWEDLSKLRTVDQAKEPLPRLADLLLYLAEPQNEHMWILLDIKPHDDPELLCSGIANAVSSVPTTGRPWSERIVLAVWKGEWISICRQHMPGFQNAVTTFSPKYASAMLEVPNVHLSLFNHGFATNRGSRIRQSAKGNSRMIFSWSDNEDIWMARSIQNDIDGVITDDPNRFMELCGRWGEEGVRDKASKRTMGQKVQWVLLNVLILVYEVVSLVIKGSPRKVVKSAVALPA